MNKKQTEILEKKFRVNEYYSITRSDYENMPDAMFAWSWNDERMKKLAENIKANLAEWDENDEEAMELDFWKTMEDEAVRMGMEYYEDMDDKRIESIENDWNNVA